MHPAFSVILFTTLSGAGYGLLALVGIKLLDPSIHAQSPLASLATMALVAVMLILGMALATVGLLSSTFHLGKPLRAWRAFSQWRTSWLSREGVMAVLTYLPALGIVAVIAAMALGHADASAMQWLALPGLLLCALSLLTVYCTAMIYASLTPIPAWGHRLVAPVYLLFALQSGLAIGSGVLALNGDLGSPMPMVGVALLGFLLAAAKGRYWRDIDHAPLPVTTADAVGLPGREVRVFERPHTEGNYITREMGFVLARKHARRLRLIAVALFAVVPMVAALAAVLVQGPAFTTPLCLLTMAAVLLGAFVERWLFFAQARHVVSQYY